jgi:type VI protein secretion system component VasK
MDSADKLMHVETNMARNNSKTRHKHFVLDESKIRRAQKLLGTKTETETIERALEEVITERERTRAAWQAHDRFLKSGIQIKDVYGVMDES